MNTMILESLMGLLLSISGQEILYKAPDEATPQELSKAAKALAARCLGYGYRGIQTTIVDRGCSKVIQVTCETGFTPEMMITLNAFAQLSATTVELKFPAFLTDIQREQYQPGANSKDDKAPPGARWIRRYGPEGSPLLLRDAPIVTKSDILPRLIKDRGSVTRQIWEINPLLTRTIREEERRGRLGTPVLLIDGWALEAVALHGLEKNEEGRTILADRMSFVPVSRVVREILATPLPFALRIEEPADPN
jgi:hypothetical protein